MIKSTLISLLLLGFISWIECQNRQPLTKKTCQVDVLKDGNDKFSSCDEEAYKRYIEDDNLQTGPDYCTYLDQVINQCTAELKGCYTGIGNFKNFKGIQLGKRVIELIKADLPSKDQIIGCPVNLGYRQFVLNAMARQQGVTTGQAGMAAMEAKQKAMTQCFTEKRALGVNCTNEAIEEFNADVISSAKLDKERICNEIADFGECTEVFKDCAKLGGVGYEQMIGNMKLAQKKNLMQFFHKSLKDRGLDISTCPFMQGVPIPPPRPQAPKPEVTAAPAEEVALSDDGSGDDADGTPDEEDDEEDPADGAATSVYVSTLGLGLTLFITMF